MCPLCIGAIAASVAGLGILSKGKGGGDPPPAATRDAFLELGPAFLDGLKSDEPGPLSR